LVMMLDEVGRSLPILSEGRCGCAAPFDTDAHESEGAEWVDVAE
jgi:hypothetical protein